MADISQFKAKRQAKFPDGFVVGALAQLKSGGPIMVITELLPGQPPVAHLEWHTSDFMCQEKSYPVSALRLASSDEVDEQEADEP